MRINIPKNVEFGQYNRTTGHHQSRELLGAGFLHKDYLGLDLKDYLTDYYTLVYVIDGTGEYVTASGETFELKPGSYFQRIPEMLHTNIVNTKWTECFINFGPKLSESLIEMRVINPDEPVGYCELDQKLINEFAEIWKRLRNTPDRQLIKILPQMLDLHQQIISGNESAEILDDQAMVDRACSILSTTFEQKISLEEMCMSNGWGYEKFRKVFRRFIGVSPGQYRLRCRLDAARDLLRSRNELSIAQISQRLGYENAYEFSAQFKKHNSVSPKNYRSG